ncbi:hypothetical protein A8135_11810 [Legionella jamestowniensis]|uniref:Uncharacterized protein n=1 Tax=Legionella jamestowniensis TaxID=455 RepID=A0ABX2XUE2_9GAMM|nr:hypothetical protein [Legionella jamestowniensis]OCH98243.1 hypothetical protein A8135_11810 [Legionella jamestowniensis]
MQAKFENPRTYQQAEINLKQGYTSLGDEVFAEDNPDYRNYQHPLERIAMDLLSAKSYCVYLSVSKQKPSEEEFTKSQTVIEPLRNIINDGISKLSVETLLTVTFDTGRVNRDSLLCFLAEIMEVNLFINAFTKLKNKLSQNDLLHLFGLLQTSYEGGSRIAENLGLSSSFLKRGNPLYAGMTAWLLSQIENPHQFVHDYLKQIQINPVDLLSQIAKSPEMSLDDYIANVGDFRIQDENEDGEKVKDLARLHYARFVVEHQGKNLFLEVLENHLNYQPASGLSANLFLDIVTSESFKTAALIILMSAGLVALTIGSLGVAGLITGLTGATAMATAAAGGFTFGTTVAVGVFFAPPKGEKLDEEVTYRIGQPV